jgi:hypothetical protein
MRIAMERLLHYVWNYRLFPLQPLQTTQGLSVEILDTGLINRDAGPDFFNAKIKIGGVLWVGNVELHRRASDWFRHGHDQDPAYSSVILHVVEVEDALIPRPDGELIPQMILKVPPYVEENYHLLAHPADLSRPACADVLPNIPALKKHTWLSSLVYERLEQKVEAIQQRLDAVEQDWERAFFITLARNFGFGVNSDAFEQWARTIPTVILNKHRDDRKQIEALFFGRAGLLTTAAGEKAAPDDYARDLLKEYEYLAYKYSLDGSEFGAEGREVSGAHAVPMYRMLRLRPSNFPHLRLAQLADLYCRKPFLFSELMDAATLEEACSLLECKADGYWRTHLHFGVETKEAPRPMSISSLRLLVINTVVPFLYAYGRYRGNSVMTDRATAFLESLPPEENRIIRSWRSLGLVCEHAADSQALIQLSREYCDKRKCLFCAFGYEFMKRK